MSGQQIKITEAHLSRKAVVYLRQSSQKQVERNLESQRLQYGMWWQWADVAHSDAGFCARCFGKSVLCWSIRVWATDNGNESC